MARTPVTAPPTSRAEMAHTAIRKLWAAPGRPFLLRGQPKPSHGGRMPRRADSSMVTSTARTQVPSSLRMAGVKTAQLPEGGG
jgi:hypothetical protein